MYVNVSALDFLVFCAYLILAKFAVTMLVAKLGPDSPTASAIGGMLG